jgi:hypothetical protein
VQIKFKTFHSYRYTDKVRGGCTRNAADHLNEWLEENPKVEVISWQATPVGTTNELYITIQYREWEEE